MSAIGCPKCGWDTEVLETRGVRRRRACLAPGCDGRISTVEIPRRDGMIYAPGDDVTLVKNSTLREIIRILERELGMPNEDRP